ncbi:hypothetical protein PQQ65_33710 [Paraburkholderia strydomiana]|uniref:hypothetical protein n=1 Tax=Paraburkholderia strydomiana TaxID=1245417 RepID=UPI0038B7C2BE
MTDRIISSEIHDAYMTVSDHIADGWVATLWVVPKAPQGATNPSNSTLFLIAKKQPGIRSRRLRVLSSAI